MNVDRPVAYDNLCAPYLVEDPLRRNTLPGLDASKYKSSNSFPCHDDLLSFMMLFHYVFLAVDLQVALL